MTDFRKRVLTRGGFWVVLNFAGPSYIVSRITGGQNSYWFRNAKNFLYDEVAECEEVCRKTS